MPYLISNILFIPSAEKKFSLRDAFLSLGVSGPIAYKKIIKSAPCTTLVVEVAKRVFSKSPLPGTSPIRPYIPVFKIDGIERKDDTEKKKNNDYDFSKDVSRSPEKFPRRVYLKSVISAAISGTSLPEEFNGLVLGHELRALANLNGQPAKFHLPIADTIMPPKKGH